MLASAIGWRWSIEISAICRPPRPKAAHRSGAGSRMSGCDGIFWQTGLITNFHAVDECDGGAGETREARFSTQMPVDKTGEKHARKLVDRKIDLINRLQIRQKIKQALPESVIDTRERSALFA